MRVLIDTKILQRRTQPTHESHSFAVESVSRLLAGGEPAYFTLQNFLGVLERRNPSSCQYNGLGFSTALALGEVEKIERVPSFLPDPPPIY
jgi:hypothetical protein